jgi:hypothetical protein
MKALEYYHKYLLSFERAVAHFRLETLKSQTIYRQSERRRLVEQMKANRRKANTAADSLLPMKPEPELEPELELEARQRSNLNVGRPHLSHYHRIPNPDAFRQHSLSGFTPTYAYFGIRYADDQERQDLLEDRFYVAKRRFLWARRKLHATDEDEDEDRSDFLDSESIEELEQLERAEQEMEIEEESTLNSLMLSELTSTNIADLSISSAGATDLHSLKGASSIHVDPLFRFGIGWKAVPGTPYLGRRVVYEAVVLFGRLGTCP